MSPSLKSTARGGEYDTEMGRLCKRHLFVRGGISANSYQLRRHRNTRNKIDLALRPKANGNNTTLVARPRCITVSPSCRSSAVSPLGLQGGAVVATYWYLHTTLLRLVRTWYIYICILIRTYAGLTILFLSDVYDLFQLFVLSSFFVLFSSWGNLPLQRFWSLSHDHGLQCSDELMWEQQRQQWQATTIPYIITMIESQFSRIKSYCLGYNLDGN